MTSVLISVIVPAWNDEKRIGLCVEALLRQSLAADQYEIIVVDNGSTDRTASVAAGFPGVIVMHEPRPGSYAARNTGLARAAGEYVAFTDSDCIPDPDWLRSGLEVLAARQDVGVVAGRVAFLEPEGAHSRACLNYERHLSMRQDENAEKGNAITANWFSRKGVILGLGGFDMALKSGGDFAMSRKISQSGLKVLYVAEAVVQHPPRAQVWEITRKVRRVVGGKWTSQAGRSRFLTRFKVETRNFLDRLRAISRAKGLSPRERAEVVGLLLRVWLVASSELIRLQLGGAPTRS